MQCTGSSHRKLKVQHAESSLPAFLRDAADRLHGNLLYQFKAVAIKPDNLPGIVCHKADVAQAKRSQNLRADSIITKTHRRMRFIRFGRQPLDQEVTGVGGLHVQNDALPGFRNCLERCLEGMVAVHALAAEDVAEDVGTVHSDQCRLRSWRSHDKREVVPAVQTTAEYVEIKVSVGGREGAAGHLLNQLIPMRTVFNKRGNRDHL